MSSSRNLAIIGSLLIILLHLNSLLGFVEQASGQYRAVSGISEYDREESREKDRKQFEAALTRSRCLASTSLADLRALEPNFVIVRAQSELRLNASAPLMAIRAAKFDPNLRTTILVHGYTQSYPSTKWLRRARARFEERRLVASQNLIIMDWGRAAQGSYTGVSSRVSGISSFLAGFVGKLMELGARPERIHLVGHSLGAHVAGLAGKQIRPRLGRISALDAAGPCFGKLLTGSSSSDRLGPEDAYEVAVYHYDDDFLGLPGQHGQFDILVNGGSSQPGAKDNVNAMIDAIFTALLNLNRVLSESHTRSTEVSTVPLSIQSCQLVAYECPDYSTFLRGECGHCDQQNSQCFLAGLDFQYSGLDEIPLRSSFPGKKLFLCTGDRDEYFCQQHYQILVLFEPAPGLAEEARKNKWRLQLVLEASPQLRFNTSLTNQLTSDQNVFSHLLRLNLAQPVRFRAATLQVRNLDGSLVNTGFRALQVQLNYMSAIDPRDRRALSSVLCPTREFWAAPPSPVYNATTPTWIPYLECPQARA